MSGLKSATLGSFLVILLGSVPVAAQQTQSTAQQQRPKLYNTAKQKLLRASKSSATRLRAPIQLCIAKWRRITTSSG